MVFDALFSGQGLGKLREDAASKRDVSGLNVDSGVLCERLDDREKGVCGQRWGFVGLCVDNGGLVTHGRLS